uniref:Uncharacterized protein n=1 Tax=Chelonoidis abingdonii TaxID=106734 RepID=A0A8C0IJF9_CHEAB
NDSYSSICGRSGWLLKTFVGEGGGNRLFTLETCCGYGYGLAQDLHHLPRIFKGQQELTKTAMLSKAWAPLSGQTHYREPCPSQRRELTPGLPLASPGLAGLLHWMPRSSHLRHSRFRDLNPTLFRLAEGNRGHRPSLWNGVRLSLRTN